MSDELFEIAFSGQTVEGANLDSVKQKIGQIFKADEERLQQMFSGRRVIIKREADAGTAAKYRGAFEKAGAICEIKSLSADTVSGPATANRPSSAPTNVTDDQAYVSRYPESELTPQALLSIPLAVSGENIEDLGADVAPVGSPMQHQIKEDPEPVIDTSGIDVAPLGSDLTSGDQKEPPPPPDTSDLSMAD
jgi:hypothetical protein